MTLYVRSHVKFVSFSKIVFKNSPLKVRFRNFGHGLDPMWMHSMWHLMYLMGIKKLIGTPGGALTWDLAYRHSRCTPLKRLTVGS